VSGQTDEWVNRARCRFGKNRESEEESYKSYCNDYKQAENGKRKQQRQELGLPVHCETNSDQFKGRDVLVVGENGIGDQLLTVGCLGDLVKVAAKVNLCCDRKLELLLTRSFPEVSIVPSRDAPPPSDMVVPSWMLIGLFRERLDRFSWTNDHTPFKPYLKVKESLRNSLRQRYAADQRPVVGLAWRSERDGQVLTDKSCDLRDVAAWGAFFAALKDKVRFISLQYGDTADEIACVRWRYGAEIYQDASVDTWGDVDAVAAQVAAMDYVVSISQTAAHLAGALGVPGWLLLHEKPFPQWRAGRNICPWYPTLVPVRQETAGDWGGVLNKVSCQLCCEIVGK
jgi:hypothetical protein